MRARVFARVCVRVRAHAPAAMRGGQRTICGVGSSVCGSWELNSGHRIWRQVPPTEPSFLAWTFFIGHNCLIFAYIVIINDSL